MVPTRASRYSLHSHGCKTDSNTVYILTPAGRTIPTRTSIRASTLTSTQCTIDTAGTICQTSEGALDTNRRTNHLTNSIQLNPWNNVRITNSGRPLNHTTRPTRDPPSSHLWLPLVPPVPTRFPSPQRRCANIYASRPFVGLRGAGVTFFVPS